MVTALFLAIRIVANPLSNVFQKQLVQRSADPVLVIAATHALLTLACLPLLRRPGQSPLEAAFWLTISIAALLAVAGNVLLVDALQSVDLSLLGPVNAYKAVVSLLPGMLLIGEVPTLAGAGGILLILAGSYAVVEPRAGQRRANAFVQFYRERGVKLRFAALILSAIEAVFLKRALQLSTPLTTFVWWSVLGLPIAGVLLLLRGRRTTRPRPAPSGGQTYLWLAASTGAMQLSTLFTFGTLQVGYALALFQLSTPISVLLGYRYFHEHDLPKRLLGSAVMAAGAILILTFGRRG